MSNPSQCPWQKNNNSKLYCCPGTKKSNRVLGMGRYLFFYPIGYRVWVGISKNTRYRVLGIGYFSKIFFGQNRLFIWQKFENCNRNALFCQSDRCLGISDVFLRCLCFWPKFLCDLLVFDTNFRKFCSKIRILLTTKILNTLYPIRVQKCQNRVWVSTFIPDRVSGMGG